MINNPQQQARRDSYSLVDETCPTVDIANEAFMEVIKNATNALREALTDQCELVVERDNEIEKLDAIIEDLNDTIKELKATIQESEQGE